MSAPWTWIMLYVLGIPVGLSLQNADNEPICEAAIGISTDERLLMQGAPDLAAVAEYVMPHLANTTSLEYECMRHALILIGHEQWRGEEEVITREQMEFCGIEWED